MIDEMKYEDAIRELENIVTKLSNGNVSLDESLELYSRGISLADLCQRRLSEVEQRISIVNEDGTVRDFDKFNDEDDSV